MRPTELASFLAAAIPAHLPVLITGAPGVGKSDVVAQAAEHAGADLIISHPAVADPTDAKGLPWVDKSGESATFLPFGELARACSAKKLTVWFLDDLGQAPPSVQASYMQLLLARRVNGHVLPDCVTFIAATNRRTDRAGVSGILEPVKSRFAAIVELVANPDDWATWMFTSYLPKLLDEFGDAAESVVAETVAFMRFRPELLCKFTPSADLTNSPLPRTWSHTVKLMLLNLPSSIEHQALVGAVGEGAAVERTAFRKLFAELPNIDSILIDPDKAKIPDQPATLYAVVTALGMKANPKNFPRVARYAERLTQKQHGEFAALLLRDAVRRDATIMQTPAFVRLASGDLGQLIVGN